MAVLNMFEMTVNRICHKADPQFDSRLKRMATYASAEFGLDLLLHSKLKTTLIPKISYQLTKSKSEMQLIMP